MARWILAGWYVFVATVVAAEAIVFNAGTVVYLVAGGFVFLLLLCSAWAWRFESVFPLRPDA